MKNKSVIHLAIDGNEANVKNRVGSNMYAYELLNAIYELLDERQDLTVTVLLASDKLDDLPKEKKNWHYQVVKPTKFWTQWALPIHLFWNKNHYDAFFTPGHYAPRFSAIPYISSVMDLAFLYFPDQFRPEDQLQLTNWTAYSVQNARKVLTISNSTKQDVIKNYGKDGKDVFVAYPALPKTKFKTVNSKFKVLNKFKIKKPYLLYVGTLQPRKNLVKMIEAFEEVKNSKLKTRNSKKSFSDLQLVIAGKVGWLADEIANKAENSPFKQDIKLIGYVTEEEKLLLYKDAEASLLVGLYEGFGIPPLESISHGTIPIVSNSSSLPEVVGEAGILVDENDKNSIALGIQQVLDMTARQKAIYRKKMRVQVKKFSWKKSAERVVEEIINIL